VIVTSKEKSSITEKNNPNDIASQVPRPNVHPETPKEKTGGNYTGGFLNVKKRKTREVDRTTTENPIPN